MADLKALKKLTDDPPEDDGDAVVVDMPKRKPGRPKGSTKPPGSGRQKGTPNHTTQALRRRIHRRGKPVETVCDVAAGKTEIEGLSQADAIKLLFRAVVPELRAEIVSGPDDGPIRSETTNAIVGDDRELGRRVALLLERAGPRLLTVASETAASDFCEPLNGTQPPQGALGAAVSSDTAEGERPAGGESEVVDEPAEPEVLFPPRSDQWPSVQQPPRVQRGRENRRHGR